MSRTRANSQFTKPIAASNRYTSSPGVWVTPAATAYSTEIHKSVITDSVDRSVRVHPVDHIRLDWFPQDTSLWGGHAPVTWYYEEVTPPVPMGLTLSMDALLAHGILASLSSGLMGEFADEAFEAFVTQVPQEVDVFNFLLDFKEIGSLIPSLQKNMASTVSGGYLSYEFGWKPMLDDIQKLANLTKSVAGRLAWLRRTHGKSVRLGFYKEIGYPYPHLFGSSTPDPFGGYHQVPIVLDSSKVELRANGTLYHELKGLGGVEGELRGLIAALGLNSPSRVAWERVPFSFVVDWFARTRHITEAMSVQPFSGVWNVSNVTHSVKQYITARQLWWREPHLPVTTRGRLVASRYQRGIGLPVSSAVFYGKELSPKQLALSTALITGAVSK